VDWRAWRGVSDWYPGRWRRCLPNRVKSELLNRWNRHTSPFAESLVVCNSLLMRFGDKSWHTLSNSGHGALLAAHVGVLLRVGECCLVSFSKYAAGSE
jgi:hypothetical protein